MTTEQPLVSIVVPVYNVELYLNDCLESLSAQSYESCEIILVDDCSQDASLSLCAAKARADGRFRVICHGSNIGLSAARNTGLGSASGKYVIFVDSDDVVHPEMISRCVSAAESLGVDVLTFGWVTFHDHPSWATAGTGNRSIKVGDRATLLHCQYFAWAKFFRRRFVVDNDIRFIDGRSYEDHSHHWEVCVQARKIFHLEDKLYGYRMRSGSITTKTDAQLLDLLFMYELIPTIFGDANLTTEELNILNVKRRSSFLFVLLSIDRQFLSTALCEVAQLYKRGGGTGIASRLEIRDVVLWRAARLACRAGNRGTAAVSAARSCWHAARGVGRSLLRRRRLPSALRKAHKEKLA